MDLIRQMKVSLASGQARDPTLRLSSPIWPHFFCLGRTRNWDRAVRDKRVVSLGV